MRIALALIFSVVLAAGSASAQQPQQRKGVKNSPEACVASCRSACEARVAKGISLGMGGCVQGCQRQKNCFR